MCFISIYTTKNNFYYNIIVILFIYRYFSTMSYKIPNGVSMIYFHSGNVLNSKDLNQMAGRNASEEVIYFSI